jgi:hypothetical protein
MEVICPFNVGYKIVNAHVFESSDKKWYQNGVIFAQKDSKNFGMIATQFMGTRNENKTADLKSKFFTFDNDTICFSANAVDKQGGVVIDCQITDKENPQDYLCYIDTRE